MSVLDEILKRLRDKPKKEPETYEEWLDYQRYNFLIAQPLNIIGIIAAFAWVEMEARFLALQNLLIRQGALPAGSAQTMPEELECARPQAVTSLGHTMKRLLAQTKGSEFEMPPDVVDVVVDNVLPVILLQWPRISREEPDQKKRDRKLMELVLIALEGEEAIEKVKALFVEKGE